MMSKCFCSSDARIRKNVFSCRFVAFSDMRVYISRPSASNPRAFRMATAASPEITFSFLIRLYSRLKRRIRPSLLAVETAGNFPSCSSFRATAWMSSKCFCSMSASSANTRFAYGSVAFSADTAKYRFPVFSNRRARVMELTAFSVFGAGFTAFGIGKPLFCWDGLIYITRSVSLFSKENSGRLPALVLLPGAAVRLQHLLPETDRGGGDLHQLVLVDELQGRLQGQHPRGDQPQRLVGPRGADVGELLLLGDVHIHVHGPGVLPHDHPLVDRLPFPDEEGSPRLQVEDGVRRRPPGPVRHQRAVDPLGARPLPRALPVEEVVEQPGPASQGEELGTETDQPPRGNPVFHSDATLPGIDHLRHLRPPRAQRLCH